MSSRSSRRGALPRGPEPTTDEVAPAYQRVKGGDADEHLHADGTVHAHAAPPHWHDGNQVVVLHDYPDPEGPTDQREPYERPTLDGPYEGRTDPTPEEAEQPDPETAAADRNGQDDLDADEMARFVNRARSLPPDQQETVKANLRGVLASIDNTTPTPPASAVPVPAPAITANRLGTVLGGLELVKAGYRAMFRDAPAGVDQEWALTMAASDLIGQMLDYHRRPNFADPSLAADLRIIAEQIDQAAAARLQVPGGR